MPTYRHNVVIDALVDSADWVAHRTSGGVVSCLRGEAQLLLRQLADCPLGTRIAITYRFTPEFAGQDPRCRLSVHLALAGPTRHFADQLYAGWQRRLGPLCLSKLAEVDANDGVEFSAVAFILRREQLAPSTNTAAENGLVSHGHYSLEPLAAQESLDYMALDQALAHCPHPVAIVCQLGPCDGRAHKRAVNAFRQVLHEAAHPGLALTMGSRTGNRALADGGAEVIRPAARTDPETVDTLRKADKLASEQDGLGLGFDLTVVSTVRTVAESIAHAFAGAAFQPESYRIISSDDRDTVDAFRKSHAAGAFHIVPMADRLGTAKLTACLRGLEPLAQCAPAQALAVLLQPPQVGPDVVPQCMVRSTDRLVMAASAEKCLGRELLLTRSGDVACPRIPFWFPPELLTTTLFIAGLSGQGKTSFILQLLRLLQAHKIPFLSVETMKAETRRLKLLTGSADPVTAALARDLRILTADDARLCQPSFNLLARQPCQTVRQKIGDVLECLKACLPLDDLLLMLLADGLARVFEKHPDPANPPTLLEFYHELEAALASRPYSSEIKNNLTGALETRIGSLLTQSIGSVLACRHSCPAIGDLTDNRVVLELVNLPLEGKRLLMRGLLQELSRHIWRWPQDQMLRYVMVVDEAYLLMPAEAPAGGPEVAGSAHGVQQAILNMVNTCRAFGAGYIFATQSPSRVASDLIRSVGTKVCFRLDEELDRKAMGAAMNLDAAQREHLSRLEPGQAFVWSTGYARPRLVCLDPIGQGQPLPTPPIDDGLAPFIQDEPWFAQVTQARGAQQLAECRRVLAAVKGLASPHIAVAQNVGKQYFAAQGRVSSDLIAQAQHHGIQVQRLRRQLAQLALPALLGEDNDVAWDEPKARRERAALRKQGGSLLGSLDRTIRIFSTVSGVDGH